jgi:hypothetical protein
MRVFRSSELPEQRVVRRLRAVYANLVTLVEDIDDPGNIDARADLVIAAEDLLDVSLHVAELARGIAWQHSPVPGLEPDEREL